MGEKSKKRKDIRRFAIAGFPYFTSASSECRGNPRVALSLYLAPKKQQMTRSGKIGHGSLALIVPDGWHSGQNGAALLDLVNMC